MEDTVVLPTPLPTIVASDNLQNPLPPEGTAQAEGAATPLTAVPLADTTQPSIPTITQEAPQNTSEGYSSPSDSLLSGERKETQTDHEHIFLQQLNGEMYCECGKKKEGRKCILCENKEKMLGIAEEYFQRCYQGIEITEDGKKKKRVGVPYIEELAFRLSVHRETVMEWAKDNQEGHEHKEFSDTIKRIQDLQRLRLQERVMGRYNPTGAIFLLKTNHKFIETEKQILAGDKDEPLQIEVIEEKPRSDGE